MKIPKPIALCQASGIHNVTVSVGTGSHPLSLRLPLFSVYFSRETAHGSDNFKFLEFLLERWLHLLGAAPFDKAIPCPLGVSFQDPNHDIQGLASSVL